MATNEQDELLNKVLRLYQIWLGEPRLGDFWEQVPEAKKLLDAYITRECARKVLEGLEELYKRQAFGKDCSYCDANAYTY